MQLTQGKKAPDFRAIDQNGQTHSLSQYKGRKVVLYFYPKDDTPGCTAQACNLRDHMEELEKKGIVVLGVSTDDAGSHKRFEQKYQLSFPLLADEDKTMVQAYGVWGEKNNYGRKYMGTTRTTFLIDEEGIIAHVITKVKTSDHAAQIAEVWGL